MIYAIRMTSYFLALATELQLMIVSYITRPTDLKVLCLVSKHFSIIAAPALYHTVDIRPREIQTYSQFRLQEEQLVRLKILILNRQNLAHTRILMISEYDWYMANSLDSSLMPMLKDNCLIDFHYENTGVYSAYSYHGPKADMFPNTRQMEIVWRHQQKIQTFHSTHTRTMLRFIRKNPERARAILSSINQLILIQEHKESEKLELITWPLENLAMASLRKLAILGWDWAPHLRKMHILFSSHAFTNLTHIRFEGVIFDTELELKQCPSLRELEVIRCGSLPPDAVKLSIPTKLPIKSFFFACDGDIDQLKLLAPILSQIQELFTLTLDLVSPYQVDKGKLDQFRQEIVIALGTQQRTMVELVVRENTTLMGPLIFGGKSLFAVIVGFQALRRLALPLGLKNPIPWYSLLMHRLPHLLYFWLTDCRKYVAKGKDQEFANKLKGTMPASSILRFLGLNKYCLTRLELSTQPGLEAGMAVSIMTEMDWKHSNPLFFNRYPYSLVLPGKFIV